MNISLTPELEELIQEKVRSGMYHSASEVVRDALRLLQEREQVRQIRLAELRKEIAKGLEDEARGNFGPLDIEDIKRKVREKLQTHRKAAG